MKTERLLKALEKAGIKIIRKQNKYYDHFSGEYKLNSAEYFGDNGKDKIHFFDQDGEVVGCQIMGIKQNNDSQRDYFPGSFYHTIKSIVEVMAVKS